MYHLIKYDRSKSSPMVSCNFSGAVRVRYHFMLLDPNGHGVIIQEWRGNNFDLKKDSFTLPINGDDLNFAPLSWQFDIYPSPNLKGQNCLVELLITQDNELLVELPPYEETGITQPVIIVEDGVFVAKN